ncbi:MAG: hypothetical protein AAGA56_22660 [Myxococcota bacterium]
MWLIRATLSCTLAIVAMGACGDDDDDFEPVCVGGECSCRDLDDCVADCDASPCNISCESLGTRNGQCGDACDFTCRDASGCSVDCAAGCTIVCERVSGCQGSCGDDCDVTCRDLSSCEMTMGANSTALCDRVGGCNLRCADGEPATDCGNGRFVCAPRTCP